MTSWGALAMAGRGSKLPRSGEQWESQPAMPAEAVLLVSEEKLKSRFWWGFFCFCFCFNFYEKSSFKCW